MAVLKDANGVPVEVAEEGTLPLEVAFTDENGDAMTPNTVKYTLTDSAGAVQNDLEKVAVTPDTSVDVVLDGDDLAMQASETDDTANRYLLITGTMILTRAAACPWSRKWNFLSGASNITFSVVGGCVYSRQYGQKVTSYTLFSIVKN